MVAAIRAIVADQRPVSEEQQVGVRVEERAAGVATEAVNMPSVASKLEGFSFLQDFTAPLARIYDIILIAILVEQRLRIAAGRVHGGQVRYV
jgi:hypothetical protein